MVICSSTAVVLFRPCRIVLSVVSACAAVHSSALPAVHSCRSQSVIIIFPISFHGVEPLRWHQGIGMSTSRRSSFHCPFIFHRHPQGPFPPQLPFISLTPTINSCDSFAAVTIGYIFHSTRSTIFPVPFLFVGSFLPIAAGFVLSCPRVRAFVSTYARP